jgi:hypothetical protein
MFKMYSLGKFQKMDLFKKIWTLSFDHCLGFRD